MTPLAILEQILQIFSVKKVSQYGEYNRFTFICREESTVKVGRENGKDTLIPFSKLLVAIEGYQQNPELYEEGPSALRQLGITHITSPIHSILHLIPKYSYV